jgi:hypothetical protein
MADAVEKLAGLAVKPSRHQDGYSDNRLAWRFGTGFFGSGWGSLSCCARRFEVSGRWPQTSGEAFQILDGSGEQELVMRPAQSA